MSYEDDIIKQLTADNENLRNELDRLNAQEVEFQQLKELLRSRENEIQALMSVPPYPVIARFDRQLRHTYVNAAVKLASGIAPEAYIGKTSAEMGLPEPSCPCLKVR